MRSELRAGLAETWASPRPPQPPVQCDVALLVELGVLHVDHLEAFTSPSWCW